jgi:hypothetical protein
MGYFLHTESPMSTIYNLLHRLIAWANTCSCVRDELPGLSSREWADLPVYHPTCEPKCPC